MEKKALPKKHMILLLCSAALLVVNLIFYSLGWFTAGKEAEAEGMGMQSVDCPFELRTLGKVYNDEDVPIGYKLLDILELSDFGDVNNDKTDNRTGEYVVAGQNTGSYSVNWLLSDESNLGNNDVYTDTAENNGLKPGSRGKLVFSIIPRADNVPMTISCCPQFIPYKLTTSNGTTTYSNITSDNANNFLKGHILFFLNYDDSSKIYSDPVLFDGDDMNFEIEVKNADEVTVELYWIWPNTLPELLLDSNDPNLLGRHNIFENIPAEETQPASGSATPKVPDKQKILDQIKNKKNYYFYTDSLPPDNLLDNMAKYGVYSKQSYISACTAYNNADQFIGTNISCVVLNLICSVK